MTENSPVPLRPAPKPETELDGYWAAAAEGRLVLGRCPDCRARFFPPQRACPTCWATPTALEEAAGTGRVEAVSVVHRHGGVPFQARLPYAIAYVRLDEGLALTTSVVNVEAADVAIGMRVRVMFEEAEGGVQIPLFEPEESR